MKRKIKIESDAEVMCKIVQDQLIISIGVSLLCHDLKVKPLVADANLNVTDEMAFANAIARELFRIQPEDGKTLVHSVLYKAAERAIEKGCNGVTLDR